MGIEPTQPAWKAGVLPLNYTRVSNSVLNFITPWRECQGLLKNWLHFLQKKIADMDACGLDKTMRRVVS